MVTRDRWVRGVFVAVVSVGAAACLHAAEASEALVTFQAGSAARPRTSYAIGPREHAITCHEFLVDADGSVVFFGAEVSRWRDGKWTPSAGIQPEGVVRDAVRAADGTWLVVSQQSQQALLYRYAGSSLTQLARVPGRFEEGTTLHPAADGTVWIATKGPILYGVKDGNTVTHERIPGAARDMRLSSYPPTVSFASSAGGLWLWSHADSRASRATEALIPKGFQIYDQGRWRAVPHAGGLLGGVTLIDPNTVLCATRYKGMFSLSTVDGAVRDVNWVLPDKECCVFLHRMPSRHVLAITAEPVPVSQLTRTEAGTFGKLVVFEAGCARVLLDGIDAGAGWFDKGRPVVDTPQGTFIATVGGGLVFVSADASQAKRLDWRFGVPVTNIDRLRVQGRLLYALDRARGLAILDWEKLLRQPETPERDRWSVYASSAAPVLTTDGAVAWLDAGKAAGELDVWREGKLTRMPLDGSRLVADQVQYLAADTNGGIWLTSNVSGRATACLNYGKWRYFDNVESAWKTIAAEEKDHPAFGILSSRHPSVPIFGGGGRVAYLVADSNRLRYCDGTTWLTTPSLPGGRGFSPLGRPFFADGVLTILARDGYQRLIEGQWQPAVGPVAASSRPALPSGVPESPPENFPGSKSRVIISLRDNVDTQWLGSPEELYRGIEDAWVRFPTAATPLIAAERLSAVLVDGMGDLWFVLPDSRGVQLARYACHGVAPTLEWAQTPAATVATARIELACRIQGLKGQGLLRYRSDGGAWQRVAGEPVPQQIVVENLPNGPHTVDVRAYDELLRASGVLTCTFEVRRDYEAEVTRLVPLLGSSDFRQREAAARTLVSIGRPAVPALTAHRGKATPDERWWIQAILDEIARTR